MFELQKHGTTVQTELLAGVTTYMTMVYIVFVNPAILAETGMDKGAVFVATCLAAAFGSAFMGLYANYPVALAPGMGLNAYFTYTVVKGLACPLADRARRRVPVGRPLPHRQHHADPCLDHQQHLQIAEARDIGRNRLFPRGHRPAWGRRDRRPPRDAGDGRRPQDARRGDRGPGIHPHGRAAGAARAWRDPDRRARGLRSRPGDGPQHVFRHSLPAAPDRAIVPADGCRRRAAPGARGDRIHVFLRRVVRQHRDPHWRRPGSRHDRARRHAAPHRARYGRRIRPRQWQAPRSGHRRRRATSRVLPG